MAGYILYSLDAKKFETFVASPTRPQLLAFAKCVADGLDGADANLEKGDPILDWPPKTEDLCDLLKQRLALPDWYGDLSDGGKGIWEGAVYSYCVDRKPKDVGFRVDNDGVYWDVIEIARRFHKLPVDRVVDDPLSHFGARPFRYHPDPKKTLAWEDWRPWHSMHTAEETKQLYAELESAGPAIEKSKDEQARSDYEEQLMPALEKIVKARRMLFVHVDT